MYMYHIDSSHKKISAFTTEACSAVILSRALFEALASCGRQILRELYHCKEDENAPLADSKRRMRESLAI